jgi:tRNA threonylcarbamoyladenosine biosynthesis protein TsaE
MLTSRKEAAVLELRTHSPEKTERLGERIGALLRPGDVLCLAGTLGAGKTCLTRGLARGWGSMQQPTSPTFTLVNEYRRPNDSQRFYHMDCYRLSGAVEAQTTALDDILDAPGVLVIEWPERIAAALPDECLWIEIRDLGGSERAFRLTAAGERAGAILRGLSSAK